MQSIKQSLLATALLAIGAFLAAPSAADPDKYMKYMLITTSVQLISACYLFTHKCKTNKPNDWCQPNQVTTRVEKIHDQVNNW